MSISVGISLPQQRQDQKKKVGGTKWENKFNLLRKMLIIPRARQNGSRIKVTTIQKAHLLKKFSNVLRDNKDGISFWFNTERFMTTARRYNFVASSILRDIELSEYIEEDESVSLKTIRRLLNYCQYPEEEELMVGIQAIKHIGKALYGDEDAFLEVIDEESLCCMAEQYLAM